MTDIRSRFKTTRGRWIHFGIWTLIFILMGWWSRTLWWLLPVPFLFDADVTRFLPWGFWKKWKNHTLRTLMDWIDAIVFALVAVYFVFLYFFQNYQIPSSSLEKSLLVGDFLVVDKAYYGPRMPITPLSFPLAQHTMPLTKHKSYIENPQWKYRRLGGHGQIERNDIVVFNFPTGDTVALKQQNPDYYTLRHDLMLEKRFSQQKADEWMRSHPQIYGEIVWRPVDRRENYVKRCVGLPGDTIQIIGNQLYVDGEMLQDRPGVQYNYFVQTKGGFISDRQFEQWGISRDDRLMLASNNRLIDLLGFSRNENGQAQPVYHFPATAEVIEKVRTASNVNAVCIEPAVAGPFDLSGLVYPLDDASSWTRDDFGPLWVPCKGAVIALTEENLKYYGRAITVYEGHRLEKTAQGYLIDGEPADSYTFEMDYYWMMGDNRHNSADSRYWGFVPEDHIVGKPLRVWLSLNKDKAWFHGKVRWNRFMKKAE